ncbi:MAG: HAMP domain-containing histidine kinase [Lachnospiraceae bacterium]|nr:HAMP domain-containing histidine kinase [Lachnospiraceae bacterium]MBQ3905283.1 HAMP domain-containing histidine kinase [Lachnospiraceae bacterium]
MNVGYWIAVVILGFLCLLFLCIVFLLRKQIIRLRQFVETLQESDTSIMVPVDFQTPEIGKLVDEINLLVEKYRKNLVELQRKDEMIKETITNLAHDVRTPLTSIEGYAKILKDSGGLPAKDLEAVETILERTDTLKRLLNQLFDFARLESDSFEYREVPIDLNAILRNTAVSFFSNFEAKGQEPEIRISEEEFPCVGDPDAVTRVFSNIIFNALVHGHTNYSIASWQEPEAYAFCFQNDAGDIASEDLDRLFDRFYTTDKSRSKKTTGLGLAIAKKIVTHMDGEIKAQLTDGLFGIVIRIPKEKDGIMAWMRKKLMI